MAADWIMAALADIGPMTSVAGGVLRLFDAGMAEMKSSDSAADKAGVLASDVAAAADDIAKALVANTPVQPAQTVPAEPAPPAA